MDKETLSHYGWIVILVLVLACLLGFATPFGNFVTEGFKATYVSFWQGSNKAVSSVTDIGPENPEQIQHLYEMKYYSSLYSKTVVENGVSKEVNGAIADINDDTIGLNVDCDKKDAVAAVYKDKDGKTNVLVLKNCNETKTTLIAKDLILNLGGKTISYTFSGSGTQVAIGTPVNLPCNIVIDGRLAGSKILATNTNARANFVAIFANTGSSCTLDTVNVEVTGPTSSSTAIQRCLNAANAKEVYVKNCNFKTTSNSVVTDCVNIRAEKSTLENSSFTSLSPLNDQSTGCIGILSGVAEIYNCKITGGLSNITVSKDNTKAYINKCTLKSPQRNIIVSGNNTTTYVENSTLEIVPMQEGYTNETTTSKCPFGFTASSGQVQNQNVYCNNTKIIPYGNSELCHMQYQSPNSNLYLSNIYMPATLKTRIALQSSFVYYSRYNKVAASEIGAVFYNNIIETNEIYKRP